MCENWENFRNFLKWCLKKFKYVIEKNNNLSEVITTFVTH